MSKNANERNRNWTFILYPESAPNNWKEILQEQHINFAVSPCHDKDVNPTGEVKKAHYHVLLIFDGMKSYEQILEITTSLNATIPQKVQSTKALIRYFVHIDNPEKYQYNLKDIYVYGTIDVTTPFETSATRYEALEEMLDYIEDNGITEFSDLYKYARSEKPLWFRYLSDNCAYVVNLHIKSERHKKLQKLNDIEKK